MRISTILLAAALIATVPQTSSFAEKAQTTNSLFYEIVVTAPGTRSQGWQGTLYDHDRKGNPTKVAVGESVETNIGEFVSVACDHLWSTCGMIHTSMRDWMKTHNGNVIMDTRPWRYRLFVSAPGTKSEGFEGVLVHGSDEIVPENDSVETPMGPFVFKGGSMPWDRGGWYPVSWPEAHAGLPGN